MTDTDESWSPYDGMDPEQEAALRSRPLVLPPRSPMFQTLTLSSVGSVVPGVTINAVKYQVCALPTTHPEAHAWSLWVEYRGPNRWAVTDGHRCLSTDGTWDWEPSNSNRTDEYNATHRFTLEAAWLLASQAAPEYKVNGWTAADVLKHDQEKP